MIALKAEAVWMSPTIFDEHYDFQLEDGNGIKF